MPTHRINLIEAMERRLLMANSSVLVGDTVIVTGTSVNDSINIGFDATKTFLRVKINTQIVAHPRAGIRRLQVYALEGQDIVDSTAIAIPTYVEGGDGYDSIRTGCGDDLIYGLAGKDYIFGNGCADKI